MTTQLIPFDPSKLAVSLANLSEGKVQPMSSFLKMGKDGIWQFGANGTEIEDGARFMVNPQGFQRGYIAWKKIAPGSKEKAQKLAEIMVGATEALGDPGDLPRGAEKWDFQLGCHLKGLDDGTSSANTDMAFRATSKGGTDAINALAGAIGLYYAKHGGGKVAVVELGTDSYIHSAYGKIYTPVISIVDWIAEPTAAATPVPKKLAEKKAPAKKTAAKKGGK